MSGRSAPCVETADETSRCPRSAGSGARRRSNDRRRTRRTVVVLAAWTRLSRRRAARVEADAEVQAARPGLRRRAHGGHGPHADCERREVDRRQAAPRTRRDRHAHGSRPPLRSRHPGEPLPAGRRSLADHGLRRARARRARARGGCVQALERRSAAVVLAAGLPQRQRRDDRLRRRQRHHRRLPGRLTDHARRLSPDDRRPALAAEPPLQGAGDRDRRVAPVHRDPSR